MKNSPKKDNANHKPILVASILAICTMLLFGNCTNSDDITDIFMNRIWKLSFFNEGTSRTSAKSGYNIQFHEETFTATTPSGAVISGKWQADGKNRAFQCKQVRVTTGNISNDTTAVKMKKFLEESTTYNGDTNYLQIKIQNNAYMQFHNR